MWYFLRANLCAFFDFIACTCIVPAQMHASLTMHASRWSMCTGTSICRPRWTGPHCVSSDVESTWQKQIMSAPVIFSSPSALQEPFKGPNTGRETHIHTHTYSHAHNTCIIQRSLTHICCTFTNSHILKCIHRARGKQAPFSIAVTH